MQYKFIAIALTALTAKSAFGASEPQPRKLDHKAINGISRKLPLPFEPNRGQTDSRFSYLAKARDLQVALAANRAKLTILRQEKGKLKAVQLGMQVAGADGRASLQPELALRGVSDYLIGNNPSRWLRNVPHYQRVRAAGVYPGIDLLYYGSDRRLEFDFEVAPGANPGHIRLKYDSPDMRVDRQTGDLIFRLDGEEVRQLKPVAYQQIAGVRKEVQANYHLQDGFVTFSVGEYNTASPLIIDPVFVAGTYLGGTAADAGYGIAVTNKVYITGETASSNFAGAGGSPLGTDAFLAIMDSFGGTLERSVYIGGSDFDRGRAVTVDGSGNIYVAGYSSSTNLPAPTGVTLVPRGGGDAFVMKLSSTASVLYTLYIGGSGMDSGEDIRLSGLDVYVTGFTGSDFVGYTGSTQSSSGGSDVFAARINSAGVMVRSLLLGSAANDSGNAVAVAANGNVYVTGSIGGGAALCPSLPGPRGTTDALVARLDADLNLISSTCAGASGDDAGTALAIGSTGLIYIGGYTSGTGFSPTSTTPNAGGFDAFTLILEADFSATRASDLFGGNSTDVVEAIGVHTTGDAVIAGLTLSTNLGATAGALKTIIESDDGFIARLNLLRSYPVRLIYATYLGGSGSDAIRAMSFDGAVAYLTGSAGTGFPVNPAPQGVVQRNNAGGQDAFYASLNLNCSTSVTGVPQTLVPASGAVLTLSVTVDGGCGWGVVVNDTTMLNLLTSNANYNNGSTTIVVNANNNPGQRSGTVLIGDTLVTVNQAGTSQNATFSASPEQVSAPATGASGSFNLSVTPGSASWTATGGAAWLTLTQTSGTGSATIGYTVAANPGAPRSTSVTIGNGAFSTTFSVIQAGTTGGNVAPTTVNVSPFVGSVNAQTFTAIYSDANGSNDIDRVWLLFQIALSGQNSCFIEYSRTANVFRLRNDADNGWVGSTAPGGFPSLQNSACEINVNQSSVTQAGNQLTINVLVLFKPAFAGKRNIYLAGFDLSALSSDWTCFGTWYPGPVSPVRVNRYRLYSPFSGSHLHTTDFNEYTYLGTQGFIQEGASGSILNAPGTYQGVQTTPMYRIYYTTGRRHFWTTDRNEYETLVRNFRTNYLGEGIDGFFVHGGATSAFPLYRLVRCCVSPLVHHWTQDLNEYNTLANNGWAQEGVVGYMLPTQ